MDENNEQFYLQGQRQVLTQLLSETLSKLGYGNEFDLQRMIIEREQAIATLRELCAEHGDNDWDESLHLSDVIDKHLGRYLTERKNK